jgi:hypothetical protein
MILQRNLSQKTRFGAIVVQMHKLHGLYDVLVIGGGTAGAIAAIQAARAGANTMLMEMTSQLGGTITNCGINHLSYFRVGSRQIVAGIGWEIVQECLKLANSKMPDWNQPPPHRPSHPVTVKPELYALLAEEKALASGVEIAYHEMPDKIEKHPEGWLVSSSGKMLKRQVLTKELVDCTGDASAVQLAGGTCRREKITQPGTLLFHLTGYDPANIDPDQIEAAYQQALADGELKKGDFYKSGSPFYQYLLGHGANQQHIFGADSADSAALSKANIAARQRLLKMIRFLRRQPGLQQCTIEDCPAMIGVRESCRIVGDTIITEEDYLKGKCYEDALAYTYYYVDIHHQEGITYKFLEPDIFPTIPLSALTPQGMDRVLAAGRIISSDPGAFSALRVTASCMAMGQMAGAAAALGAQLKMPSKLVPLAKIRALLLKHGAVVPSCK